jgi:hypothetical protein
MDELLQDLLWEKIPEDKATFEEIIGVVSDTDDPDHLRMVLRKIEKFSISLAENKDLFSIIRDKIRALEA